MRNRKHLIGAIAALASVVALSSVSVASADIVGLRIGASVTPAKQKKKERGPVKVFFESNDIHQGPFSVSPCAIGCYAFPPSVRSFITFPTGPQVHSGHDSGLQPVIAHRQVHGPCQAGLPQVGRRWRTERPGVL